MKIATLIIRTLIGLLLLFASISFFLKLVPEPVTTGDFKAFQVGLIASAYLMPLAKAVELLCGLAYVSNKFVTLGMSSSGDGEVGGLRQLLRSFFIRFTSACSAVQTITCFIDHCQYAM